LFGCAPAPNLERMIGEVGEKRSASYTAGALLGILLTVLAAFVIALRTDEIPRVVSAWPLLAAVGTSLATWWLQAHIYAVLARPQLKSPRAKDMFRVEMAGLFVALISPIRGAELPYKVYLLGRLGLSAGEGTNVVVTRVLLDGAVLTPAALVGLMIHSGSAEMQDLRLLVAAVVVAATLAAVACLVRRAVWGRPGGTTPRPGGSDWRAKGRAQISTFFANVHRSFASYWRAGHRTTLVYALALATIYWALRLCAGPLALMAVGWSDDWIPVVVAQLLLVSFVLPFAPTPGGGGARELGLVALLSGYVPEGQLLSGLVLYTALSHWLPLIASAFFAGHELWRGIFRGGGRKAVYQEGHAEATTRDLPTVAHTTPPRPYALSGNREPEETRT
jgi:glycosyltransferase 2 family protein